jgi:hypothetical protein
MEPRPPTIAGPHDDVEPWRQSSCDLHQGLEVTEISQHDLHAQSAPPEPTRASSAAVSGDLETAYVQRLENLSLRLPDRPAQGHPGGLLARRFDGVADEEAGRLEAMWWDRHRTSP